MAIEILPNTTASTFAVSSEQVNEIAQQAQSIPHSPEPQLFQVLLAQEMQLVIAAASTEIAASPAVVEALSNVTTLEKAMDAALKSVHPVPTKSNPDSPQPDPGQDEKAMEAMIDDQLKVMFPMGYEKRNAKKGDSIYGRRLFEVGAEDGKKTVIQLGKTGATSGSPRIRVLDSEQMKCLKFNASDGTLTGMIKDPQTRGGHHR